MSPIDPQEPQQQSEAQIRRRSWIALCTGAVIAGAVLLAAVPSIRTPQDDSHAPVAQRAAPASPAAQPAVVLADFGSHEPSDDARRMANWIVTAGDNQKMPFVIVDKKDARVYVFEGNGHLKQTAPALMGAARGDDSFPGIGEKPLAQVKPEEKTTPAGRFIAELGVNTGGEDIVWVDYDAAVSMHRVRALVPAERRLERLASPTPDDNRISFGCINLPKAFYEDVLKPTVQAGTTVIYVLPETRPLQAVFAGFRDPAVAEKLAQRQ